MRYNKIRKMDISNGEGIRVSIFVQGCSFNCQGCFNPETHDFNGGKEFTKETLSTLLKLCDKPMIKGLSILGGEPLHSTNVNEVFHIVKTFKEKLVINEVKTKKFNKQGKRVFSYMAEDKYLLQIGQDVRVKNGSPVSGDSCLQIRLSDGKYLLAISDGMGSGPEARKSSQIAIKMLERLLMSGFDKNTSIDLINTTIMNTNEEIFATLYIVIIDLFNGKVEFIKNGACPTYIKNGKNVQIVKSLSLPAGILKDINLTVYDKDIINQDILVMCSDGIIDSNVEYKNKELWVKYLLEDIETTSAQKIADLIINESVDNNYGMIKDDMSLIVCKILKI